MSFKFTRLFRSCSETIIQPTKHEASPTAGTSPFRLNLLPLERTASRFKNAPSPFQTNEILGHFFVEDNCAQSRLFTTAYGTPRINFKVRGLFLFTEQLSHSWIWPPRPTSKSSKVDIRIQISKHFRPFQIIQQPNKPLSPHSTLPTLRAYTCRTSSRLRPQVFHPGTPKRIQNEPEAPGIRQTPDSHLPSPHTQKAVKRVPEIAKSPYGSRASDP